MSFNISRNMQDSFVAFLEQLGLSSFGCRTQDGSGIENEVFLIRPYRPSSACTCSTAVQADLICEKHKPNFHYFAKDVRVYWEKYPLRQATSNIEISDALWAEMFSKCLEYIRTGM